MTQISIDHILVFGGENNKSYKDIDDSYLLDISNKWLINAPPLPVKILPENPGYTLNSFANFYFLGNISTIFKFNKFDKTW